MPVVNAHFGNRAAPANTSPGLSWEMATPNRPAATTAPSPAADIDEAMRIAHAFPWARFGSIGALADAAVVPPPLAEPVPRTARQG